MPDKRKRLTTVAAWTMELGVEPKPQDRARLIYPKPKIVIELCRCGAAIQKEEARKPFMADTARAKELKTWLANIIIGGTPHDFRPLLPHDGPVALAMTFHMAVPKCREDERGQPHIIRPDGDNLVKLVMDAMNGLVYKDDGQVYRSSFEKVYASDKPAVGLTIVLKEWR